jgi:hypothetical protein
VWNIRLLIKNHYLRKKYMKKLITKALLGLLLVLVLYIVFMQIWQTMDYRAKIKVGCNALKNAQSDIYTGSGGKIYKLNPNTCEWVPIWDTGGYFPQNIAIAKDIMIVADPNYDKYRYYRNGQFTRELKIGFPLAISHDRKKLACVPLEDGFYMLRIPNPA